ncbi:hypothetical protein FDC27_04760 [Clostridium botulinum]|nr:hypothetical protein [Clostridium botulinum]NFL58156.1 hypothetical protein [Clostridium botulinum]NFL62649.1 hypothetical protein [Clostridium botulinum]NFO66287.1 hypothetical protein [Clostridium botulinum]
MENRKEISKEILTYIIITLIGAILTCIGIFGENTYNSICLSIGCSIISTAMVYFLLKGFVGDPLKSVIGRLQKVDISLKESVELLDSASKTGLINVYRHRAKIENSIWIEELSKANDNIDILGYAVNFLPELPEFSQLLTDKGRKGCKIRIILGEPDGKYIKERNKEEKNEGSIKSRIETTIQRLQPLIEEGLIEVRLQDIPLYCSIYRFDEEMIVTPQLYGTRGAEAPVCCYKNIENGIFKAYCKHFNNIWVQGTKYIIAMNEKHISIK